MKNSILAISILVAITSLTYAAWKSLGPPNSVEFRQTIFEPATMTRGFRTMSELFPSRNVSRGEKASHLPGSEIDLSNISFSAGDKNYRFEDLLEANDTQGLLILHGGRVVYQKYFNNAHAGTRFTSWSVAKSFTSTLVGLAIGEGHIENVNDQLTRYLPQLKGTAYDGVTIAQALQMSSGVAFTEVYDGDEEADVTYFMGYSLFANLQSANEIAASFPRAHEPGTHFNYNTAESQILGLLVATVTGKHAAQYLEENIWQPLGMSHDASWNIDQYGPTGAEMGGCCINASLRDYARFGQLFSQDGVWQGKRLLPEGWVQQATEPDAEHLRFGDSMESETGYQYQWWRMGENAFSAEGVHGQFIYVNPKAKVVIAKTSTWETAWPEEKALVAIAGFHAIAKYLQSPTEQ